MGEQERTAINTNSEEAPGVVEMSWYLKESAHRYTRYQLVRTSFLVNLDRFAEEAKGSVLEQNAKKLAEDFRQSIDVYMLRIFQLLDLQNNPEALGPVLSRRNKTPEIRLASEEERQIHGEDANAWYDIEDNTIAFAPTERFRSYDSLKHTFFHEFAHAWIGGRGETRKTERDPHWILEEAMAEFIAFSITGIANKQYENPRMLAAGLYDLDRDMFVDWYCLRNDDAFLVRLERNLRRFHSQAEAELIAQRVVGLDRKMPFALERVAAESRESNSDPSEEELIEAAIQLSENELAELATKIRQR